MNLDLPTEGIVLIKGPTGSGKTRRLQKSYQALLDKGVRADQILVLVRNRRQSILWRDEIKFTVTSNIRIQSFFGFIQGEIKKYWTMVDSKINGFKANLIEPVFLTTEVSQFLISNYVEQYRNQGKLMDITSRNQKIAIEGLSNLSRAVTSGIDLKIIGKRLIETCNSKNAIKERAFNDFQELLNIYVKSCLDNGYIDYFFAIDIYNTYLFEDEGYRKRLNEEIKYLIVDGMEEAVPCEVDFLSAVIQHIQCGMLAISTDDTFSRRQGACPEYVEKRILPRCSKIINIEQSFTCKKEFFELSHMVYCSLLKKSEEIKKSDLVVSYIQTELRSEMIKRMSEYIENLIGKGARPGDIVVISPMIDSVLEYCLQSFFGNKQINVSNISRTSRYIDDSFIRALITLACLCHPRWELNPPEHDISNLVGMVLGLDPIRSALIASEVVKLRPFALPNIFELDFRERIGFMSSDKYHLLKRWIEDYRDKEPVPIDSFFQNAFVTILLNVPRVERHINACRQLIESAGNFLKIVGSVLEEDVGKAFVEMIKEGVKPAETIQDLEQKIYSQDLIISTPQSYLASSMNRSIQVWVDVSSPVWYRSDAEELSNPYILSPVWKDSEFWTDEMDEKYRMMKCGAIVKQLLRRCSDRLILAESQYNQDGFENDGVLSEIFNELAECRKEVNVCEIKT